MSTKHKCVVEGYKIHGKLAVNRFPTSLCQVVNCILEWPKTPKDMKKDLDIYRCEVSSFLLVSNYLLTSHSVSVSGATYP